MCFFKYAASLSTKTRTSAAGLRGHVKASVPISQDEWKLLEQAHEAFKALVA